MSESRRTTSTTGTVYILCPFFKSHGSREIICEAEIEGCVCGIRFDTGEKKEWFKQCYCEKEYKRCEHYLSVMHWKWEEE